MNHPSLLALAAVAVGVATIVPMARSGPGVQPDAAAASARPAVATRPVMTLDLAQAVARRAIDEARTLSAGGAIAVVDDGGHLVALVRLDGTFPAAAHVAEEKARTAAIFRKPTQDFENAIKSGRTPLLGVDAMTPLEGGVPIIAAGEVVGAVGVSGAHSSTEDVRIARAGASVIGEE